MHNNNFITLLIINMAFFALLYILFKLSSFLSKSLNSTVSMYQCIKYRFARAFFKQASILSKSFSIFITIIEDNTRIVDVKFLEIILRNFLALIIC